MKILLRTYDAKVARRAYLLYFVLSLPHLALLSYATMKAAATAVPDEVKAVLAAHPVAFPLTVFVFWSALFCSFQLSGYANHFNALKQPKPAAAGGDGKRRVGNLAASSSGRYVNYHDDDDGFLKNDGWTENAGQRFNIDGTPMMGHFDANGNPFGVTGTVRDEVSTIFQHDFNTDGSAMMGEFDTNGHSFGEY